MSSLRTMIALLALVLSVTAKQDPDHESKFDDFKKTDAAACVGNLISASGYLSSAGMMVASVHRQCSLDPAYCTKHIAMGVSAFAKSAAMADNAADSCGGIRNACGWAVSQSAVEISKAAAAATGFFGAYDPELLNQQDYRPKVENAQSAARAVGEYLQKSADAIVVAVKSCPASNATDTAVGNCVGLATRAAFDLAAVGIQADGAHYDCPNLATEQDKRKCATDVFYMTLDSAKSATRFAGVADICAKSGKAKCSAKVTDFIRAMSRIGIVGTSDALNKEDPGYDGASQMDDLADALKDASVDVNDAIQVCGGDEAPTEGVCVGDSLSGASHMAAAGLALKSAVKDCDMNSTMAQKIHCTEEVMKTMSEFAHVSMELLDAAADCGRGKMYDTMCGFHVSHGFHVLGKAATFGAKSAMFADKAAALDGQKPDYDGLAVTVQKMGKKLNKFANEMDKAANNCKMVGQTYAAKFDMNSRAHKWLSAGAGEWRGRKQPKMLSSLRIAGICSLAAFIGLTMLLVAKKVRKHRGVTNRDIGLDLTNNDTENLRPEDSSDQAA